VATNRFGICDAQYIRNTLGSGTLDLRTMPADLLPYDWQWRIQFSRYLGITCAQLRQRDD
jgi:hypothetical protein